MWPFSPGSGLRQESFIIRRLAWASDVPSTVFLRRHLAQVSAEMAGGRVCGACRAHHGHIRADGVVLCPECPLNPAVADQEAA